MLRKILIGLGVTSMLAGAVVASASSPAPNFSDTFDGVPASPQNFQSQTWDVQVHSRDRETWFNLEPINAQHGSDCSAPPATHVNTSYEGSVFICNNHIMTSLNTSGYGVIYLTPNQIFDFSSSGSITFEMSTEKMSRRDWWDILITPYQNNMSLPLISNLSQGVDLQGAPLNTIHIGTDNGEGAIAVSVVRNGVETSLGNTGLTPGQGIDASVNQAATRQTFKLTIANGRIKFERLASSTANALVYIDTAVSLPFSSGIVQFGHHSYNPTKDGSGVPATWHWDNIQISPSTEFTMIKADRRYTTGGVVNFSAPAPANSYLRFSGVCKIKVNGVAVNRVPDYDRGNIGYHPEHTSSYFVPIAQGTQSVNISFADDDWYATGFGCIAKDFSIWSLSTPTIQTPTPTSTTVNTTPTNTSTPIPTFTPTPTTILKQCRIDTFERINGVYVRIKREFFTADTCIR